MKKLTNYYKPTPKKWRKIGDAFLIVGMSITTFVIFADSKWIASISLICTILGKLITNFATDGQDSDSNNDNSSNSIILGDSIKSECEREDCNCGCREESEDSGTGEKK